MASIFEQVTTTEEVEYELPYYIKRVGEGFNLYSMIFSATRQLVVDSTAGLEKIYVDTFPSGVFQNINENTASDETEWTNKRAAVDVILDAITPTP